MVVDHTHVGAISVEPDELESAIPETGVIVTRDAHVGIEPRKATRSAREALGNDGQIQQPTRTQRGPSLFRSDRSPSGRRSVRQELGQAPRDATWILQEHQVIHSG
jgi:hypothetical protein